MSSKNIFFFFSSYESRWTPCGSLRNPCRSPSIVFIGPLHWPLISAIAVGPSEKQILLLQQIEMKGHKLLKVPRKKLREVCGKRRLP